MAPTLMVSPRLNLASTLLNRRLVPENASDRSRLSLLLSGWLLSLDHLQHLPNFFTKDRVNFAHTATSRRDSRESLILQTPGYPTIGKFVPSLISQGSTGSLRRQEENYEDDDVEHDGNAEACLRVAPGQTKHTEHVKMAE